MSYNLTGIGTNSSGLLTFIQAVNNELMFGYFGILLLLAITIISFMSFMFTTNDVKKSIGAAGFIAFGLAIFLKAMMLIPSLAMFITLLIAAGSISFAFMSDKD